MKTNHLFRNTLLLFILISILSHCSKFEEGPILSLHTVKGRLAREWKIEFSRNLESGIEHSADFEGWLLNIDKNGDFYKRIYYGLNQIDYNGKWELVGNTQLRLDYNASSGNVTEFYIILRLTKKELWLKNMEEEIHYYSE